VYRSAVTLGTTKSPLAFVTATGRRVPRVSLMRVTVAPGMTAPLVSVTVPDTEPVVNCADAGDAAAQMQSAAAATRETHLVAVMFSSLEQTPERRGNVPWGV
jgi:hypothetical protein